MPKAELIEDLFLEVCGDYLRERNGFAVRGGLGVFSTAMVTWLGIQARLGHQSLKDALGQMIERISIGEIEGLVQRSSRKHRDVDISLNSGGLSRARSRTPEAVVRELFKVASKNIEAVCGEKIKAAPIYIVDGTIITTAHSKETVDKYGIVKHRKKAFHYPKLRVVSAHRLDTGICTGLEIGTYTDHEIVLATKLLDQIPKGSILLMDRGFMSPSLATKAKKLSITIVVRLKNKFGKELLSREENGVVNWSPLPDSRREPVTVPGRVAHFVSDIPGFRSSEFYLFSNSNLPLEELAELYAKRVQIETGILHLKQTLKLFFITAKTPAAIQKDIYIAYLTFNLVRGVMTKVANEEDIAVNRISFTSTVSLMRAYSGIFLHAPKSQQEELYQRFKKNLLQAKLPVRKTHRSYPREVKMASQKYTHKPYRVEKTTEEGK